MQFIFTQPVLHYFHISGNYKAYLETLLSYNELAMKGHLKSQRFLIDDTGFFGWDGSGRQKRQANDGNAEEDDDDDDGVVNADDDNAIDEGADAEAKKMGKNQEARMAWFNNSKSCDFEIPLASGKLTCRCFIICTPLSVKLFYRYSTYRSVFYG